MSDILIELDDRRRASLGRIGHHDRYLAREEPDGTVILTPAVVMSQDQAVLTTNPELMEQINQRITSAASRTPRERRKRSEAA